MVSKVMGLNPYQCLGIYGLEVHGFKCLGYHADLYTLSRCRTRGESENHIDGKHTSKGSTLALKPGADVKK